jgi:hypothetical protein
MTTAHRFVAAIILLSVVMGAFVHGQLPVIWTALSVAVALFLLFLTRKRRDQLTGK